MYDFVVLMIATNKYVNFALDSIETIDQYLFSDSNGNVIIFTDQPELFCNLSTNRVRVTPILIDPLKWPEATLLRYSIFEKHWDLVDSEFVIYLDADTLVKREVRLEQIMSQISDGGIALVQHPGFYKNNFLKQFISRFPRSTWETNKKSKAHVPMFLRKVYVCGGVWMGFKRPLGLMIKELSANVRQDLDNGIIAIWHDESHLNCWLVNNSANLLSPEWAYSEPHLKSLNMNPIIEVVTKAPDFKREKTEYGH